MKKSEALKVYKLLKEYTRAEIMARHGDFGGSLEFGDYFVIAIEKMDEIRKFLYGTDNLVELGQKWKMLKTSEELKDERLKKLRKKIRKKLNKNS